MNRYNHIAFNPKLESIISVCNRLGGSPIWSLSHVVPVTEYEWVAVFEAFDGFAKEDKEFGRIPVSPSDTLANN